MAWLDKCNEAIDSVDVAKMTIVSVNTNIEMVYVENPKARSSVRHVVH
jgi:hypothetical protein